MHAGSEMHLLEHATGYEPNDCAVAQATDPRRLSLGDEWCALYVHARSIGSGLCHTLSVTSRGMVWLHQVEDGTIDITANRSYLRWVWLELTEAERAAVVARSVDAGSLPEEVLLETLLAHHARREGLSRRRCAAPGCDAFIPIGSRPNRTTCSDRCRQRLSRAGGLRTVRYFEAWQ